MFHLREKRTFLSDQAEFIEAKCGGTFLAFSKMFAFCECVGFELAIGIAHCDDLKIGNWK